MKALFINASPRKNWNTHKMLESSMKGAGDSGAEIKLIHLYDYNFKGCVSCFACLCAYRDELRPVLEEALNSDIIVIGSPIYFSYPTGMMRSFLERFLFPIMSYSLDENGKRLSAIDRKIYSAVIYTMNCPEDLAVKIHYLEYLEPNSQAMQIVLGYCETLCAYDTYQFTNYDRYEANIFSESEKAQQREKVFPEDLKKAYELGARLVRKANNHD